MVCRGNGTCLVKFSVNNQVKPSECLAKKLLGFPEAGIMNKKNFLNNGYVLLFC